MERQSAAQARQRTRAMVYIAAFAALMAACAWISIPAAVPFTMQTFGVFLAFGLLGGRRGTIAVLVYLLLGAMGLPVFAGFMGGFGVLLGTTGGYLAGFLLAGAVFWGVTALCGARAAVQGAAMALGLLVCYAFGTAWFMAAYARGTGPIGLSTALSWCVLPYLLPDAAKLALALLLTRRLKRWVALDGR